MASTADYADGTKLVDMWEADDGKNTPKHMVIYILQAVSKKGPSFNTYNLRTNQLGPAGLTQLFGFATHSAHVHVPWRLAAKATRVSDSQCDGTLWTNLVRGTGWTEAISHCTVIGGC